MLKQIRDNNIFKYNYLLSLLIAKNVKSQYYRSFLGVVWTVLNPLLNMIVMAFVFGSIFGLDVRGGMDFPVYIMSGLTVFGLMRASTSGALGCLVGQSEMLHKTKLPMWIFPTSNVLSALVSFGFSFAALIIVMLIRIPYGAEFHWAMLMIVFMLPSLLLFSMGLSFVLASVYVFFRDLKHIYSVVLTLWQYLTPVFYSITAIKSAKVIFVIKLNPMYHYVEYFRTLLLGGVPSGLEHLICYGYGIVMFVIGLLVLKATKNKIVSKL